MYRGENAKEAAKARWEARRLEIVQAVEYERSKIEASYNITGPIFENLMAETILEGYLHGK